MIWNKTINRALEEYKIDEGKVVQIEDISNILESELQLKFSNAFFN